MSDPTSGGDAGGAPPPMPPPVNPGNMGRGPMIMGVSWSLTALCVLVIGLRFYVRKTVIRAWSSDDWFMLAAVLCQIVFMGFVTEAFRYGLGKHDADLTVQQLTQILKWNWISTTPALCVSILARISAAILLIRIFGRKKWLKWFLITFTSFQSVFAIVLMAMVWACTTPVQGIWNPLMPAKRWDPRVQEYSVYLVQALFTVSDLTYVLFPILIIFKLNMPMRRKVGLAIMMSMSLVTVVASIMKTLTSQGYSPDDEEVQYEASIAILWSALEQTLVILMSCIPPLRAAAKVKIPWLRNLKTTFAGSKASDGSHGSRYGSRYGNNSAARWSGGHHAKASVNHDDLFGSARRPLDLESGSSPFSSNEKVAYPSAAHGSQIRHGRGGSEDSTRGIIRTDTYGVTFDSRTTSADSGNLPMAL